MTARTFFLEYLCLERPASISVCTISGPEVGKIGRALESVAGWTLERIVVLNEEVQDGTEEVARANGATVYREPWKGYIGQKNSAAAKARGDWVLDLDADEAVSPALKGEILQTLARGGDFAALNVPRLSWYCGRWIRHGDWYPDRQTRLWRRGQARWGGVDPHAILQVDGPVRKLKGDLFHYSRQSLNAHLQKLIPFSDEFVKQQGANGKEPGMMEMAVRPWWRFLRAYVLRLGFLDGWPGYYIAAHTAFSTLVRYAKVREARLVKSNPPAGTKQGRS